MAFREPALRFGLAVAWLALCGCAAKRELQVFSEPPGALVRIDDEVVGLTPYVADFVAYGTRRVTLYHDGYRTSSLRFKLDPPWHSHFPIDFFSEVLFPFGWSDIQIVRVALEPEGGELTSAALDQVLGRAESLRLAGPEGPRPSPPSVPAPEPSGEKPLEHEAQP